MRGQGRGDRLRYQSEQRLYRPSCPHELVQGPKGRLSQFVGRGRSCERGEMAVPGVRRGQGSGPSSAVLLGSGLGRTGIVRFVANNWVLCCRGAQRWCCSVRGSGVLYASSASCLAHCTCGRCLLRLLLQLHPQGRRRRAHPDTRQHATQPPVASKHAHWGGRARARRRAADCLDGSEGERGSDNGNMLPRGVQAGRPLCSPDLSQLQHAAGGALQPRHIGQGHRCRQAGREGGKEVPR